VLSSVKYELELVNDLKKYEDQERHGNKLKNMLNSYLGEMRIPVYNTFSEYNFYDTLIAFVFKVFHRDHKHRYDQR
jgi:hypothetical protein